MKKQAVAGANGRTVHLDGGGLSVTDTELDVELACVALSDDDTHALVMELYRHSDDPRSVPSGEPWLILGRGMAYVGLRPDSSHRPRYGSWPGLRTESNPPLTNRFFDEEVRLVTRLVRPAMDTEVPRPERARTPAVYLADVPMLGRGGGDQRLAVAIRHGIGERPWNTLDLEFGVSAAKADSELTLITELIPAW